MVSIFWDFLHVTIQNINQDLDFNKYPENSIDQVELIATLKDTLQLN